MKTKITLTFLAVIMTAVFSAWWYFSRPILIGVVLPIDASLGNEENLFIRYEQDKHPHIGLRPVEFLIENPPPKRKMLRTPIRN